MFKNTVFMMAVAAVTAPAMFAEAAVWCTDFEAAKAQAAREGKAILLDFTGSDWCGWCIQLHRNIFDTPAFQEYAKDKFVLVEVDMPRTKRLDPALTLQNNKLCRQFEVSGYPTILIISPEEDVLGGFVGGNFTMQQVCGMLDTACGNLGKLRAARAAEGVERASLLGEIYKSLPKVFRNIAQGYAAEIAAADPENLSHATVLSPEERIDNLIADIHNVGNDYARALELIDAVLVDIPIEYRSEVLMIKAQAITLGAETEEDIIRAREVLQEAATLMGYSRGEAATLMGYSREARELRNYIDQVYGDPAALLREVQQSRQRSAICGGCGSDMQRLIADIAGADDATALRLIEAQLAKGNPEERPELLRLKGNVLLRMADSLEDVQAAKAVFMEAVELWGDMPEGGYLRDYVESEFQDEAALLERVRRERASRAQCTPEQEADMAELHEVVLAVHRAGNNYPKALEIIDAQLAKGKASQRAELLRLKGICLIYMAETEEDLALACSVLKEAAELTTDPEEAAGIRSFIEGVAQDPQSTLDQNKASH